MFSEAQRRSFKRDGYLCLQEELDDHYIAEARKRLWDALPFSHHTIGTTDAQYLLVEEDQLSDLTPFRRLCDQIYEYADALVGGVLDNPQDSFSIPDDMTLPMNLPDGTRLDKTHQRANNHAHIDGFGDHFRDPETDETYVYNTVNAVVYFNQVVPGGGGFVVYPGSHHVVADYFETHSLESPGWTGYLPAINDDGGWHYSRQLGTQIRDLELTGGPGTLILYHNKLLHKAGFNQREQVRMAGITRYTHQRGSEIAREAGTDLWRFWPAMDDISVDLNSDPVTAQRH